MSKMDFDTNLANIVGEWSGRFITEHSVREANTLAASQGYKSSDRDIKRRRKRK